MRVISGKNKGKKLKCVEGLKTRPTLDRIKESLFNVIQFKIEGKKVLDLFAGSGQLGIEALSRGALSADFCEIDKQAFEILQSNLTGMQNHRIFNCGYKTFFKTLQTEEKYDIIFIDPPFGEDLYSEAIISSLKALHNGGIIICESDKNYEFQDFYSLIKTEKVYGKIKLTFLENVNK